MTVGYDATFIPGEDIPLPSLGPSASKAAFNDGQIIRHSRFSLVFHRQRGFALYTAHNIDGETLFPEGTILRDDDFRIDPDIPHELQIDNRRGYKGTHNPWDRGHLVRRASLHWGNLDEAKRSDNESFFWTNIAPQHNRLHQSSWGKIERWMVGWADEHNQRCCVFTGPVFTPDDPGHQNFSDQEPIRIPAAFWKIMVIKHGGRLKAAGFLVWQRDYDKEIPVTFDPHLEQVRITTLEHVLGMSFGTLRDLDPLRFPESEKERRRRLTVAVEPTEREPAKTPATGPFVASPNDIIL